MKVMFANVHSIMFRCFRLIIAVGILYLLGIVPSTLLADNLCNGQVGAWTNGTIWSQGREPIVSETATIYNNGHVTITENGEAVNNLRPGLNNTGTVEILSGTLFIDNDAEIGYNSGGNGILIQSGGDVIVDHAFYCGRTAGGHGTYRLSGGTITNNGNWYIAGNPNTKGTLEVSGDSHLYGSTMYLGQNDSATMHQTGGNVALSDWVYMAASVGVESSYQLDGGRLYANLQIGRNGSATFTQTGGTNEALTLLAIGYYAGATGTYNMVGGEAIVATAFSIGNNGVGVFNFGDADSTGTIQERVETDLFIGRYTGSKGTLRGWGTIDLSGYIYNMGRVIADGYGTDRTLNFSSMNRYIQNDRANAGNDGWFAQDHGKLVLPAMPVNYGHNYWGDEGNLDLINAVDIDLKSGGGTVTGSLLAPDHGSVPEGLFLLNAWEFTGGTCTADFTFLYDEESLSAQKLDETNLSIWRHDGTNWINVTATLDAVNNKITTTTVDPGLFAVGRRSIMGTIILVE